MLDSQPNGTVNWRCFLSTLAADESASINPTVAESGNVPAHLASGFMFLVGYNCHFFMMKSVPPIIFLKRCVNPMENIFTHSDSKGKRKGDAKL